MFLQSFPQSFLFFPKKFQIISNFSAHYATVRVKHDDDDDDDDDGDASNAADETYVRLNGRYFHRPPGEVCDGDNYLEGEASFVGLGLEFFGDNVTTLEGDDVSTTTTTRAAELNAVQRCPDERNRTRFDYAAQATSWRVWGGAFTGEALDIEARRWK